MYRCPSAYNLSAMRLKAIFNYLFSSIYGHYRKIVHREKNTSVAYHALVSN